MKDKFTLCIVLAVLLLLGWGGYSVFFSDDRAADGENGNAVLKSSRRMKDVSKRGGQKRVKPRTRKEDRIEESSERERPSLDDAVESELTKLQKEILKELQSALDRNDLKAVRRAIARFSAPKSNGGLDGDVPKVLRQHAVSALGWFGSAGVGDLVEFMADVDPEIEEDAFAKFELALDDWEMGDRERSEILISALSALNDTERIDSLMMNLNNMRNSVKADTILKIASSGTPEARAMMQEQVGFYTEADVETVDAVKAWQKANPDDPGDEEFYGPQKEN